LHGACTPSTAGAGDAGWLGFTDAGLQVVIGEWSLASWQDSPANNNLSDPDTASFLRAFYANQRSAFVGSNGVVGAFRSADSPDPARATEREMPDLSLDCATPSMIEQPCDSERTRRTLQMAR
jgi:hypothetical protein